MSELHSNGRGGDRFYVQVRYRRGDRWVTVGCEDVRRDAARQAAVMFRDVVNDRGQRPMQVRIVPTAGLRDGGGHAAIALAHEDLLWHAVRANGVG
jgi:hypothetical protein